MEKEAISNYLEVEHAVRQTKAPTPIFVIKKVKTFETWEIQYEIENSGNYADSRRHNKQDILIVQLITFKIEV